MSGHLPVNVSFVGSSVGFSFTPASCRNATKDRPNVSVSFLGPRGPTMRYAHLAPGYLEQEIGKIDEILSSEKVIIDDASESVKRMVV